MKKRILSLLLVICLVAVLLPTAAFATDPVYEDGIAKVSDEDGLRKAIFVDGATSIKLMDDITLKDQLKWQDKEITLDLNGHVLGNSGWQTITLTDTSAGGDTSLTLIDSAPNKSNTVGGADYKGGVLWGKITLTVSGGGQRNCCLYANGGSVTGTVGLDSVDSSIYCTSNTPTVFYDNVGRWGEIYGGIFRGKYTHGIIYGGIFYGTYINTNTEVNYRQTYGGIFYGNNTIDRIAGKTVTFKYNDNTYAREIVSDKAVNKTAVAPIPPQEPNADGYHIRWYEEGADFPYDFSTPVTKNITLEGRWENTYILTFDTDDGSPIAPFMYAYNAEVTAPEAPTKSGYMFTGWEPEIPETMPMEDITVTAQWMSTSSLGWLGGLLSPLNSMVSSPFVDVPPMYYFFDAVKWAVENGITTGTGSLTFSPDAPCTRAEAVTFLWRAAGCPESKAAAKFTDVDANAYYAKAVAWAVENGITNGTSDTTFSPAAVCTRAQIVTFLCRAFGETSGAATPFTDVAADAYYAPAVSWAAANGVTGGTGDGKFSPNAPCTRAQIVTFLWRTLAG